MTQPGETSTDQQLLAQAKRQTELLAQINMLLWAFAGAAILVGALLIINS